MGNKPIRVLHIIDHLGLGGTQVLLADMCTWNVNATSPVIPEVLVLHGAGVYAERLLSSGVPLRSLAASKSSVFPIITCLIAHLSRRDYDIVHLHLEASSLLGSCLAFLFSHAPVFVTVYSLKEQYRWPRFHIFSAIAPIVDVFVSLWRDNTDLQSVGIPDQMICIIPPGIDFRGFDPARHAQVRRDLCARYAFAADRPLLLSVARLAANRHIHLLVESMIHIVAECPEVVLLMVGDGEERERLEAIIREHHLEDNIIFAGVRTDVWDLYPGCDIYMSSSGNCDTGVAAMQAMACGRPVVAYTIAQMAEPQKLCACQGIFVQARDPLAMAQATLDLLREPERARILGERARVKVFEDFSLDRMMQRYSALYSAYVNDKA